MAEPTATQRERARLQLVLGALDALPTLSPVATRLTALGGGDEVEVESIVQLIEADPALTGKILGLCRRAGLGLSEPITTVHHATVMLGLEAVRSAVLSVAVYEALESEANAADERAASVARRMNSPSLAAASFDRTGFWRYSIGIATASELIATEAKQLGVKPQEAFVAGLLAEVGKLMLDFAVPKGYARVLEYAAEQGVSSSKASRRLLGMDHREAAAHVGKGWDLPPALIEVMGHDDDRAPQAATPRLIELVRAGISIARSSHIGFSGEAVPARDPSTIASSLNVDPDLIARVRGELHEAVGQRCEAMGLDDVDRADLMRDSISTANANLGTLHRRVQQQEHDSRRARRVLASVNWFGKQMSDASPPPLASAVAASACRVFGGERWTLVRSTPTGWSAQTCDAGGELIEEHDCHAAGLDEAVQRLVGPNRHRVALTDTAAVVGDTEISEAGPAAALVSAWRMGLRSAPVSVQASTSEGIGDDVLLDGTLSRAAEIATLLGAHTRSLRVLAATGQHTELVGAVAQGTASLGALVRGIRRLREQRRPEPATHELLSLVTGAVEDARDASRFTGEIDTTAVDASRYVTVDRGLVQDALTELLINAMEASKSGRVEISAHRAASEGRWVVRVTNEGEGPPEASASRLFDPFVAGGSGGPGLGLTRTRAWMRSHGGDAELNRTEDGKTQAALSFAELDAASGERSTAA